ncbi:MAG: helix-turn-helix transcriptional regulator [Zoogloea sp.]|nr:helix-turn-helix transcriptional regulator [Zoogloea sp.]
MIKCHLSRLLGERKLKISDVTRDTGINRGTLTRLYHETAERVELDVLDSLCVYLNCGLPDLLEYQKSEQASPAPLADSNG